MQKEKDHALSNPEAIAFGIAFIKLQCQSEVKGSTTYLKEMEATIGIWDYR